MAGELEAASDVFDPGDLGPVRELLEPLVADGDLDAQVALGTFLTLSDSPMDFVDGLNHLKAAVGQGSGVAANNLSTALHVHGASLGIDPKLATEYARLASKLGFPGPESPESPEPDTD